MGFPVIKIYEGRQLDYTVPREASVAIAGTFRSVGRHSLMTISGRADRRSDIKIQADQCAYGSGMKDGKLKSKTFSTPSNSVDHIPLAKIVQLAPTT